MEDTLRVSFISEKNDKVLSLNPCFNGRYSQSNCHNGRNTRSTCLNPCFNGRYSQRAKTCVPLFIVV